MSLNEQDGASGGQPGPNSSPSKTVFLTGGSGVLGHALLRRLAGHTVVCLVHHKPVDAPNAVSISGDITAPRLGLSNTEYAGLAGRIDCVVHAAAITKFDQPDDVILRTNIDGTKGALELAAAAGVPVYHVSTAFLTLSKEAGGPHDSNPYERSKIEAERMLETSGLDGAVLRPSVVVGDSTTGEISRFQGFHFLMDLFVRGFTPINPSLPNSYVDFVPQDVVADAIAALVEKGPTKRVYWLTAGDRALSVQEIIDLWVDEIPRATGKSVRRPRMVSPDIIERLIEPVFLPALPAEMQSLIKRALPLLRYLTVQERFPTSLPEMESELGLKPLPDPRETLIRNVEWWAATRERLKATLPTV